MRVCSSVHTVCGLYNGGGIALFIYLDNHSNTLQKKKKKKHSLNHGLEALMYPSLKPLAGLNQGTVVPRGFDYKEKNGGYRLSGEIKSQDENHLVVIHSETS